MWYGVTNHTPPLVYMFEGICLMSNHLQKYNPPPTPPWLKFEYIKIDIPKEKRLYPINPDLSSKKWAWLE